MEGDHNKANDDGGWKSVPAFGEWDTMQGVPDYSMDFTKIREMKKQSKQDFSRVSVGNEEEIASNHHQPPRPEDDGLKLPPALRDHICPSPTRSKLEAQFGGGWSLSSSKL